MPDRAMIEIASPELSAAIDPFGAELHHLRDAERRELMTDADPAFWTSHAPILFPVVGRCHDDVIRIDGTDYPMDKHGFARRSLFELARHDPDHASFQLAANALTRTHYPFDFVLNLDYTLRGATLYMEARLHNPSDKPLPASFGWHPAFAWPLPYGEERSAHRLTFDADEPGLLRRVTPEGYLSSADRPSPLAGPERPPEAGSRRGRELLLRDELFLDDALVWDPVASSGLTFGAAQGPVLRFAWDAPRLGVWTKPGAQFVCIEPWHGHADPEDFRGEYRDKPGVFEVAPGAEWKSVLKVTLEG